MLKILFECEFVYMCWLTLVNFTFLDLSPVSIADSLLGYAEMNRLCCTRKKQ